MAAAGASGDPEHPGGAPAPKQTRQWFEKVDDGEGVRVINPLGNVYARFGGYEGKVEILATIQKLDPTLPDLEVERNHVEGGLEITARHRPVDGQEAVAPDRAPRESRDRIDLVLFVPLGAALDIETIDGSVEVKGIKSDLDVRTTTGNLKIAKVEGRVHARSARGTVSARLETDVTREPQSISTETGSIEVYLWEDANLQVALATSGRIATDFSLEIEHRRFEEPGKHATAVVGEGGPSLTLQSQRGAVALLQLPRHFHPED